MSPDHVWEMCRDPSGSRRRRGDVFTSITEPLFSHTCLEVCAWACQYVRCIHQDTQAHTLTVCCDSKLVFLTALASVHTTNTEGADTNEKPCDADSKGIWIWNHFFLCTAYPLCISVHGCIPTQTYGHPLIQTHANRRTHTELLWLIATIRDLKLISSVLCLIKGTVWSYYSVYIFICLPPQSDQCRRPTGDRHSNHWAPQTSLQSLWDRCMYTHFMLKTVWRVGGSRLLIPPSDSKSFRISPIGSLLRGDKHYKISCWFHKLIKYNTDTQACFSKLHRITKYCKKKKTDKKGKSAINYLTVTLGSCVTPHVITALVPLMTLWSCGGLVMRVRAVKTEAVTQGLTFDCSEVVMLMLTVRSKWLLV